MEPGKYVSLKMLTNSDVLVKEAAQLLRSIAY